MPDVGVPPGLRISIGGNIAIIDELGGSIDIEYETSRLRRGEAFIIFIDGEQVDKVTVNNYVGPDGYTELQHV